MFSSALDALATFGGAAVGGAFNYFGQDSANRENRIQQQRAMEFNERMMRESNAFGRDSATQANSWARQNMQESNRWNRMMSREQMAFQERMAGSQYQRGIADMRKAGLNPMLLFTRGAPAPSPSGAGLGSSSAGASSSGASSASIGSGNPMQNKLSGFANSISSAISLAKLKSELDLNKEMIAKVRADTAVSSNTAKSIASGLPEKEVKSVLWSTAQDVIGQVKKQLSDNKRLRVKSRFIPDPFK